MTRKRVQLTEHGLPLPTASFRWRPSYRVCGKHKVALEVALFPDTQIPYLLCPVEGCGVKRSFKNPTGVRSKNRKTTRRRRA